MPWSLWSSYEVLQIWINISHLPIFLSFKLLTFVDIRLVSWEAAFYLSFIYIHQWEMLGKHWENAALSCSNWEFTLQNGKNSARISSFRCWILISDFRIFLCVGIFLYMHKYMYVWFGFFLVYMFSHYSQCFMFTLICTFIIFKDSIRQKKRRR